jgi:hypothetical protein
MGWFLKTEYDIMCSYSSMDRVQSYELCDASSILARNANLITNNGGMAQLVKAIPSYGRD